MFELRLGDDLDDFCIKCKRITKHVVVSMVGDKAAKVRCRSCYSEHDNRNQQAPPTKKELKKAAEAAAEAAAAQAASDSAPVPDPVD